MTTQHTPGRLKMQNPHAGERGFEIALEPGLEQVCHDVTEANARRLVACWNWCEGQDTDGLELSTKIGRTAKELELIAQRDELLAALKNLMSGIFDGPDESDATALVAKARAAIAKAEGGAK